MLSKTKTKFIISLQKKKTRDSERLFVIEGDKIVKEFILAGAPVKTVVGKPEFIASLPQQQINNIDEIIPVSYDELKKISSLTAPHNALAIVAMPPDDDSSTSFEGLAVALDCIQDPGNLGPIIRAAAWFGIKKIFCSHNCCDVYNAKVIQASMGAILHVDVNYTDLNLLLTNTHASNIPIYGALLQGENIYKSDLSKDGLILLGNESKGISDDSIKYISHPIMIPRRGHDSVYGIDSLNVGMAASVIFSEFARRRV